MSKTIMVLSGSLAVFLLLLKPGLATAQEDPADFSSPKAQYCFSKNVFSQNFNEIDLTNWEGGKEFSSVDDLEKSLVSPQFEVSYPSSKYCDGGLNYDCRKCYRKVAKMLKSRSRAFQNEGLVAPSSKHRMVVVGAGPTGLRASIDAALMGYDVSLIEARDYFNRGKVLGMFSTETSFLASVGMPESMVSSYDIKYRKDSGEIQELRKSTMALRVKQNFLWQIAEKLGVKTYQGCVADPNQVQQGKLVIQKSRNSESCIARAHGEEHRLNKASIKFDRLIIADGSHSAVRDAVMNKGERISFPEMAKLLFETGVPEQKFMEDSSSEQYYYNRLMEEDENGRGGFQNLRASILENNLMDISSVVFVSDVPSEVFGNTLLVPTRNPHGIGHTWGASPMRKDRQDSTQKSHRWHIEGDLPAVVQLDSGEILNTHSDIIAPFLKHPDSAVRNNFLESFAHKVFHSLSNEGEFNFHAFDRFTKQECGKEKAIENGITFFEIKSLYTTKGDFNRGEVAMAGDLKNGSEYFIVGDAFQDPWYSFGVGQHDGNRGVIAIRRALGSPTYKNEIAIRDMLDFEESMRRRVVQVLLHIYASQQKGRSKILNEILKTIYQDKILGYSSGSELSP